MLEKEKACREAVEIVCIDDLVPKDHLLRKIDKAVDFSNLYTIVEGLYSEKGRPSVDPVVLFKIVLIQHIFGIASLRQTLREVAANVAYRWFIGYGLNEAVPHFATVSHNFRHRFSSETVEQVFSWILEEVSAAGFLSPEAAFLDATHVKANANLHKKCKKIIPRTARTYERQLREEVNAIREEEGKKPFDDDPGTPLETREVTASTTDPDCGLFHKGEHRKCFAYGVHTACDRHNFILDAEVTPGNVHDSVMFDALYDRLTEKFPQLEALTMDTGYKTPWICKRILDDGRIPSLPYKRPMTKKGNHPWWQYVYDEYYDQVICPEYQLLSYGTTTRDGCREYKSKPYICKNCPTRMVCTQSKGCQKTILLHIWHAYLERAEDIRHSPFGKALYALRCQTIERVFADAKEKHAMRFTYYRGLTQVTKWVKLKFAAMNLKKLALWKARLLLHLRLFLSLPRKTLARFSRTSVFRQAEARVCTDAGLFDAYHHTAIQGCRKPNAHRVLRFFHHLASFPCLVGWFVVEL